MPLVKRYPNRKLYDTEAKRYVTLDGIAQIIRTGHDVQVIDHETGEDLTNLTLSQIIFELEKKRSGFLPRAILTSLIRTGGDTLLYLRRSLQAGTMPDQHVLSESDLLDQLRRHATGTPNHGKAMDVAVGAPGDGEPSGENPDLLDLVDAQLATLLEKLNIPTYGDLRRLQEQLAVLADKLDAALGEEEAQTEVEPGQPEENQTKP